VQIVLLVTPIPMKAGGAMDAAWDPRGEMVGGRWSVPASSSLFRLPAVTFWQRGWRSGFNPRSNGKQSKGEEGQ
jgi:hypothetical protein